MHSVLLIIHIASAIIFIGAITVATSLFPRYATNASAGGADHAVARLLHRITYGYGRLALITPVAGFLLALVTGRASELWILLSIALVAVGGGLLAFRIVPLQRQLLADPHGAPKARGQLGAASGIVNLTWLAVLVLMVTQPG